MTSPPDPGRSERSFAYQPALDGLRALAVLAVIGYHDGYSWAPGGFLGVDAFFVLSGYLITSLLVLEWRRAESIGLLAFWGRRIRRLLPALLLVLLFVAIYAWVAMPSFELGRLRGDGLSSLFYVANWRFVLSGQSYFDLVSAPSPVRHLWSLAIEEQFYLVWPLVVLACVKLARGSLRLLAAVCVAGIVVSVWLMDALYQHGDPSRAYYGTDARMHTILVGCLLAILFVVWTPRGRAVRIGIQLLGVVGAIGAVVAWNRLGDTSRGYYGLGSLLYALAIAAVVAAAVQPGRWPLRAPLSWRPLRWVGTISYGLYLWHWPINQWLTAPRVGVTGNALNVVRLAVTFGVATASFYLVERPIRYRRFTWQRGPSIRWIAPAGVMLVGLTLVVGTAGAETPPSYLGGGVFNATTPCAVAPSELAAGRAAYRSEPLPAATVSRGRAAPMRLLVLGDSTACSLLPGLQAVAPEAGITVEPAAVIGCGIVSAEVASSAEIVPAGTERCPQLVADAETGARAAGPPDLVLWMSVWEKNDLVVDGATVPFGSPQWRTVMQGRVDAELARLTADGAHVVLVTQPSHSEGSYHGQAVPRSSAIDAEFNRLDDYLREVARTHPQQVTLVDLADKICPGGPPCAPEVEGRKPRPIDGAHFTPQAAVWVSEWLVPQLQRARSGVAPGP